MIQLERCPKCNQMPAKWTNQSVSTNHIVFWIGCQKDGLIDGGYSQAVAVTRWNRLVHKEKYYARMPNAMLKQLIG